MPRKFIDIIDIVIFTPFILFPIFIVPSFFLLTNKNKKELDNDF